MTLDAKIRITAEGAQAVKVLRDVESAGKGARDAVTGTTTGKPAFTDVNQGAIDAAANTRKLTDEAKKEKSEQAAAAAAEKQQAAEARQRKKDENAAAAASAKEERERQKVAKADADAASKAQRQATNQARQLGPQLTDIAVGLTTGQSPFTVLLQQGGQLKDVFGGVGNAAKALGSIFTVTRVVVGGVAAAIAGVAFAAIQGQQESTALAKTLALTGNVAATSAGQLDAQARSIAANSKASIGDVRETLTGLVASGEFTSTSLGSAGRAAVALSKLTGQTAAESIKSFEGMSEGVAAWARKSDRAYNFLTAEQLRYITSLEAQGRAQEAMKFTLDTLASTLEQRAAPAVGTLEKAWSGLKNTLAGVLDGLKAIGRDETAESSLAALKASLDELIAKRAKLAGKQDRTSQLELARTDPQLAELQQAVQVREALQAAVARGDKRAAGEKQADNDRKLKDAKGYQDALSAISEAGAQKALAERLAVLDKRQSETELANAKGLTSEVQYNLALNAIDQERLKAQAATIERQIAIAGSRKVEKPEDTLANQAQVTALQAQLASVKGQIAATATKGLTIAAADALADAREKARDWAQIWQKAYDQVRTLAQQNGVTQAALIADPVERATADAANKTADLRRQVAELKGALELKLTFKLPDGERAEIEKKLAELNKEGPQAIDSETRLAKFASFQTQISEVLQTVALKEADIDAQVARGKLTTVEAEQAKFEARAQAIPQLEEIQRLLEAIAVSPAEKNAAENARQAKDKIKDTTTELEKVARSSATTSIADGLTAIVTGSKSAKSALLDVVSSFTKAMLDVLSKRLAEQLVNQFADAVGGSGGGGNFFSFLGKLIGSATGAGAGTSAGSGVGATYAHTGAVVGSSGGWQGTVPASVFGNALRYHGGGIVGLKPRERPIIAEDGEEVLDAENPRHVRNFKAGGLVVTNNVTISGGQGGDGEQRATADSLLATMNGAIEQWAATEGRQGGRLANGRR